MGKAEVKQKILICDLDGCLIDTSWIWQVVNSQKVTKDEAYDIFNRLANADKNKIELPLFKYICFKASGGAKILFLTARSEIIEAETINFLQKKTGLIFGKDFTVSFRPSTDLTSSSESKAARVQVLLDSGKEILMAIDDDDSNLRMYEAKGIKTLKWKIGFIPVEVVREFGNLTSNLVNIKEELCLN